METNITFFKKNILILLIVLLSTVLSIIFLQQKINYHIDELLTYSLANSTSYIDVEPGEKYNAYGEFQESFLSTPEETNFDYANVWRNQANDVHPPFYYVIVHTISSVFSGEFSPYIGIAVNLIFNAFIIVLLYKFAMLITGNKFAAFLTSVFWAVNPGVISDMMFIRMYIMTMFFCLWIAYIHLKNIKLGNTVDYKFYISVYLVSLAGALTHYYFLILTFFICAIFVFYLLFRKQWRKLFIYIGAYVSMLVSVIVLFPSIYDHILGGGQRGEESIENFMSTNGYLSTLHSFWGKISDNLFGGYLLFFVIAIVIIMIASNMRLRNQNMASGNSFWMVVYLLVVCSLYFFLISNIAVYTVERYLQPIFPLIVLIFICLLHGAMRTLLNQNNSLVVCCILLLLISVNGYWKTTSFEYLQKDSAEALQIAEQYQGNDVIYLYDRTWKIPTHYMELANYKSVTFYKMNDLAMLYEKENYDEFVVYSQSEDTTIMEELVEHLPAVESYTKLNNYGYCTVYYLE
ncbi:glycosyltransferase family 39 protein [Gracilibacillus salinarum]|uniref:Glycosyltransferase family 39 protein n=1 Tax=Gracilibacillus salinarum TaxID=2932255 RepID=A0ABY4GRK3_9BACI|nr:glycosyltransferase family 39 protein [Gracilibacillus salinarum]UOQ86821.1 glycosyltransferase family 39 protein [Gracilibacillus salinarum]